jgi:hypothetical protein
MGVTASNENIEHPSLAGKYRHIAIGVLFALVLLLPKLLRLRRNPAYWLLFRIAMGISGAALVILPLSIGNSWFTAVGGLVLFAAAVLLPSPKLESSLERKARELRALAVVNGGAYQPGNAAAAAVRLFVSAEHVWALDRHYQPLLVIPTGQISHAGVKESGGRWILWVRWAEHSAEFFYHGLFAENLVRTAETTLSNVMSQRLPVLPRSRAASA